MWKKFFHSPPPPHWPFAGPRPYWALRLHTDPFCTRPHSPGKVGVFMLGQIVSAALQARCQRVVHKALKVEQSYGVVEEDAIYNIIIFYLPTRPSYAIMFKSWTIKSAWRGDSRFRRRLLAQVVYFSFSILWARYAHACTLPIKKRLS